MLHAECTAVSNEDVLPADDVYIERSDTVRGYEVAPGR